RFMLWAHQAEALGVSLASNEMPVRNPVVTSATGSGKTEAFLLPIFARLLAEVGTWPQAVEINRWWASAHGQDEPWQHSRIFQAAGRDAAVRALILYPTNALVEDQIE